MDMRFGTWNVRSMSRAGSLRAIAEEISKYNLNLVGVQEVRWDGVAQNQQANINFFYGKGNESHELGTGFFTHKRIVSAVKWVEFVSDRMSYMILRGCWCNIMVLNIHVPTEDKIDDIKDRFYEELEQVFDKFPKYHMKILLRDLNSKVGREDIFKPTIGNESLHATSNDDGVRVVNFSTSKNLTVKSKMFHIITFIKLIGYLLMGERTTKLTIF
jgi:exonuclease III